MANSTLSPLLVTLPSNSTYLASSSSSTLASVYKLHCYLPPDQANVSSALLQWLVMLLYIVTGIAGTAFNSSILIIRGWW